MSKTRIPYADVNWPVVTGCSGEGCTANCWARSMAKRFRRDFTPRFHDDVLLEPLGWKKPRRVLVAFTGDLFDKAIGYEEIACVYNVMATTPRHTFLVLTKQSKRMAQWYRWVDGIRKSSDMPMWMPRQSWPLKNVWLGVSVATQGDIESRLPDLLSCISHRHWLSCEPLLGPIDLASAPGMRPLVPELPPLRWRVDYVVASGETGPRARPCDLAWIRRLRDDCSDAGVAFAYKDQVGFPLLDGKRHDEVPA